MPDIRFFSGNQQLFGAYGQMEILLSPGVSPVDSFLRNAISAGATVKSDLDLFFSEVDLHTYHKCLWFIRSNTVLMS